MVGRCQTSSGDFQRDDDEDEAAVEGEEDARLLDGAAVAQEADDEDEGPGRNEEVRRLSQHQRLQQILLLINYLF